MGKQSLKVRVYFPYFPFPGRDGSAQVVCDQILALRKARPQAAVELVTWLPSLGGDLSLLPEGVTHRKLGDTGDSRILRIMRRIGFAFLNLSADLNSEKS